MSRHRCPRLRAAITCFALLLSVSLMAQQPPVDSAPDYTRLTEPTVAAQLQLTDEQRAKVAQLLQQRTDALANPDQDQRDQQRAEIDTRLAELLSAEQRQSFASLPGQAKLTFNFRDQKWIDVLDWFARQAGLSLVVNEIPPGGFTYSDTRAYSPTEALDLLNGVLSTRGFTLIRRDRMLICADLSKGFPDGLIPEVQLEDLDQYGDFELVQVSFPLGGRPAQAVSDEITPLLEPNGRATVLPQTKQLLVTARAGKMRAISAVIASIPEPRREKPKPPKPPAPKPELQIYPVESLDLQATVEMLDKLVGGAEITIDQQAGQLNVFATPGQHAAIKKYLEEMSTPVSQQRLARLEIYSLETAATEEYVEQLSGLAPGATIVANADPPQLAIVARPAQHKKLEEVLGRPLADGVDGTDLQAEVYTLRQATPSEVADVIKNLLPKAEVATDAEGGRVVVVASAAQHAILRRMIEQFDSPPVADRQLKFHPLPERATNEIEEILQPFAPKATIQIQSDPRRLMVIASESDQQTIQRVLQQLSTTATQVPQKTLRVYSVTPEQRRQFVSSYKQIVPELQTITIQETQQPSELQIVAAEDQQLKVAKLLEDLKQQFPEEPRQLKFYDVPVPLRARFTSLKDQLVPELKGVQVVDGDQPDRMGLVATDAEHARAADLLKQLRSGLPLEESQLRVFPVTPTQRRRFLALLPSLQNELPGIRVVETSLPTELTIWGRPAQHDRIDSVLQSIADRDAAKALQLVAYPVKQGDPSSIQTVLQDLYPDTKITADTESSRVLVWTTPAEHEQIDQAVRQLDAPAAAGKNKMVYYRLDEVDARDVLQMFQELTPEMTLVADRDSNSIIAWGSAKDHEKLAKTVEDFRQQAGDGRRAIVSYPYGNRSSREVEFLLGELAPQARLVGDRTRRMMIVWATPEEHQVIQQAMLKVTGGEEGSAGELRVYTITRMDASDVVEALEQIAPLAQISVASDRSQLLIWADPGTHDQIRDALKRIEAGDPDEQKGALQIYQGRPEILTRVRGLLPQVAPQAQEIPDSQTDRLAVWALPQEHTAIDQLLKSLDSQLEPADLKLATYTLKRASTTEAQQLLTSVVPDVQFLSSADPQQLLIRARPQDHTLIQATLDELEQALSQPQATEVKVYTLGKMAPATLTPLLDPKLTAGLSLIPDAERKVLIVRATAEQHTELKAAIDELVSRLADAPEKSTKIYRFQHADPASARLTLMQLLPESAFVVDLATRSLTATALPADHERIQQIITQLDQPAGDRETVVYRLEQGNVSTLLTTLQSLLPQAVLGIDAPSRTLVATATKEDQQQIRQVVQQMDDPTFSALETKVYRVQRTSQLYGLQYGLRNLSPDAIIVPDMENGLLVVTARPSDQKKIEAIIEQLNDPQAAQRETKVYRLQHADPASARLTLSQLLPTSLFTVDVPTNTLVANAMPEDHVRIQEIIQQLDQPRDDGRETVVYRLEEGDVTALASTLQSLLPEAVLGVDRSSRTLVATASKEDQLRIRQVVEQMDDPSFSAMETKVYRVLMGELYSLRYALRSLSPDAVIVTDSENGLLVATASPADQKKIEAVVEQLNDPAATQRETKVYRLHAGELYGVRQALRSMLPRADISIDDENRAVLVTASPEDHVKVKAVLDELDSPDADTRETKVYRFRFGDVDAAQEALEALLPQAVIASDDTTRTLVATASKTDHLRIDATVQQLDVAREDATETRVYNFQLGDVVAAQTVLQSLLPEAVFAVDPDNRLLVATAYPAEHERIQVTVKELDRPNAEQPSLQAYPVTQANFQSVYNALDDVFRRETEVRISADPENQTILVMAPPEEHRTIAQIVSQMENSATQGLRRRLVVYPLKGEADDSLLTALQELFAGQQPAVELSLDTASDQVLAVATEKQHELIRGAIEQMQGAEAMFEVFPLQTMDPFYAELAIDRLYADETDPPVANGDSETQQLVVRGTRKQLDEVRQLLTQMGELPAIGTQNTEGLRVIPYRGDVQEALEQIQTVWPRLRNNPLRVVQPPRVMSPLMPRSPKEGAESPPTSAAPAPSDPAPSSPAPPTKTEGKEEEEGEGEGKTPADQSAARDAFHTLPTVAISRDVSAPDEQAASVESSTDRPQPANDLTAETVGPAQDIPETTPPQITADEPSSTAQNTADEPSSSQDITESQDAADQPPLPDPTAEQTPIPSVVLIPGQGSITVMSQDPEALNQVEMLLRTLARQSPFDSGGGNFAVYALTNAGAGEVAQMLDQLFEKMPFTTRGSLSRVAIVADERLNSLIVHGRPNDRALIAELLQVLDSSNVPNMFVTGPPVIVPLQNTDASRVMEILQGIYATQLKSGGSRTRITVPRGVPSEVATMLRQMNAAAAGPLLTLQVDRVTNAIVILAPKQLGDEVEALVQQLDQKAQVEDARRIGIVPLKSSKAEQLEEALQQLMRQRRGRGR